MRGLDERNLKPDQVHRLLEVIEQARRAPLPNAADEPSREVDRELRPAVGLMSAWVSQLARDLEIETALLATRADLEALLRGDEQARLAHGWRAELVGEPVRRLLDGDAALAFERGGELVLEARSRQRLS